jgi:aromatic ring hydroxylase
VGRKYTGELIYHEYNTLTEIAGGIAATLPFGEDFQRDPCKEHLQRFIVRNPNISAEESLKIWKLVENVGASPMTSWYEIAGVHGGGSPIMEAIALGVQFDFESRKKLARYLAGIETDFDDSKDIQHHPTFGDGLVSERLDFSK